MSDAIDPVETPETVHLAWAYEPSSTAGGDAPSAVLYVMVTADGSKAKIGACYHAGNTLTRRRDVEKKLRSALPDEPLYPLMLAVVAEIRGLALGDYDDPQWDERWAEVEHLESATRLAVARRVGRLSRFVDYVEVDADRSPGSWADVLDEAWTEASRLGRGE
jgi:hypothetical protein